VECAPSIGEVLPEHAPGIADLLRKSFAEFEGKLDPPSGALFETAESVIKLLETSGAFAVFIDSQPVACVFFRPDSDFMYLYRLGVLPAHRRKGLGRLLIDCVQAKALEQGFTKVRLATRLALPGNIAYYERLGYIRCGVGTNTANNQPFYTVLEKSLSPKTKSSHDSVRPA